MHLRQRPQVEALPRHPLDCHGLVTARAAGAIRSTALFTLVIQAKFHDRQQRGVWRRAAGSTSTSSPDDRARIRKTVLSAEGGEFVSVGLHEPDEAEMARMAEIFGLHLAVEDSLT